MGWLILAAAVCGIDLLIKNWIGKNKEEGSSQEIAGGRIVLTKYFNKGAMLGMMKDNAKLLSGITLVVIGIIFGVLLSLMGRKGNVFLKFGLSLILGGAASNAYERVVKGEVTDYFRLRLGSKKLEKVIFNLGDMTIFIGSIIAMIAEFFRKN